MTPALHAPHRTLALSAATRARAAADGAVVVAAARDGVGTATTSHGACDACTPARPWLAPSGASERQPGEPAAAAVDAGASGVSGDGSRDPALATVVDTVRGNLAELASDPESFHAALAQAFGDRYDKGAAETIRRQTLAGDFSWMPEIRVVDAATLGDTSGTRTGGVAGGAYAAESDTIYLSRELLESDPEKAASVLTEEIGHGLDERLNASDSAGDEGEIFARTVDGERLSDAELASLRAENDKGTIVVDGRTVEVEYFLGKVVKAVTKPFRKVGEAIVDGVKKVGEAVVDGVKKVGKALKKGFDWVMNSSFISTLMTIAQFVPIPIVQLVARGYQLAKAAYSVYQGIKHGNVAAVLGGVAGVAGGVGKFGSMLGASSKFVGTMETVSNYARLGAQGYAAVAKGDFRAALSLARGAFGDTAVAPILRTAEGALMVRSAAERGDVAGAVGLGANLLADLPGTRLDGTFGAVARHAESAGAVLSAVSRGDYGAAASLLVGSYGDELGLDARSRARVADIADTFTSLQRATDLAGRGDYAGAAGLLLDTVGEHASPATRAAIDRAAGVFERLGGIVDDIESGELSKAANDALAMLGEPLDDATRGQLIGLLGRIERLGGLRDLLPRAA